MNDRAQQIVAEMMKRISADKREQNLISEMQVMAIAATRAAREMLGHMDAYAGWTVTGQGEEVELVWEVGILRVNAPQSAPGKEAAEYKTRDLWGRGATLEDALRAADFTQHPRGGRRR